ncbi:MAG: KOW domain-containing RNA-binding protein [Oscillospiraceae bacterium]|nr:KOW domain-containing RNA-binding protein [Oscillospiraceae bacterium]
MKLAIGDVVKTTAGKDKDSYFCVVELIDSYCFLRDGKIHKLENPKRKSFKHVIKTPYKLQSEALQVNKHLKKAIYSLTNTQEDNYG